MKDRIAPNLSWSSPGEAVNGVTALPEHSNPGLDLGGFLSRTIVGFFFFYNSFALSRSFHSLKYQLYRRNSPKLIERKCNILGKFNSVKENGLQSLLQDVFLYESSAQVSLEASDKNLKSIPLYMEKIEFIGRKLKRGEI